MAQADPQTLLTLLRANALTAPLVMCRAASDPLLPGAVLGYACRLCGRALQVLPTSRDLIEDAGGIQLCNPCALSLSEWHAKHFELTPKDVVEIEDQQIGMFQGAGKMRYPD